MYSKYYIGFTTETNGIDYIEKTKMFLEKTATDPKNWKWVVIALHGALYSSAICALQGTNPSRTVCNKNGRLISLDKAIEYCQKPERMRMMVNGRVLKLSEKQKEAIQLLKNVLRNEFMHFKPKLWAIDYLGLPEMGYSIVEIVKFLFIDSGNYIHIDKYQRDKIELMFNEVFKLLNQLRIKYMFSEDSILVFFYRLKKRKNRHCIKTNLL